MDVTIGITCHNNGDNIDQLLSDIESQEFNDGVRVSDVLIVASGCTDTTISKIHQFQQRDSRTHLMVETRRAGKPSAINKIASSMSGDVLVLLCGDVRLPSIRFIESLASRFENGIDVVGCRPVPDNGWHNVGGYIGHTMWNLHDKTLMAQLANGLRKQAGEAFAVRKDALEPIPLNVINDDAFIVLRAQINGRKFAYARDVTVRNRTPDSLREILLQRARIIRGHRQLKDMIGASPDVLDALVFRKPFRVASVVLDEVREQIKTRTLSIRWFLTLILVEIAAHLLSLTWIRENHWPPSLSAKRARESAESS
jgi:glycosyltransferase involved in cell wall biosynthesis